MRQFRLTAPALPLVSATLEDDIPHLLQIERPIKSRAEVVKLDDDEDVVCGRASSGVELYLEKGPFLV